MNLAVGIDLGTTYSCVAYYTEKDDVKAIAAEDGNRIVLSAVYFDHDDDLKPIVGVAATKAAIKRPRNLIKDIKCLIGKKFRNKQDLHAQFKSNFNVSLDDINRALIKVENDKGKPISFRPPEISAIVLKELAQAARNKLGDKFNNEVVITVPAYFNNDQRAATIEAGKLAGLKVLRLLNEPTAAALAYAHRKGNEGNSKLAVYDLGGGTFDISIIEINGKNVLVKAIAGDCNLGGRNMKERLVSLMKNHIQHKYNIDVDKVEPTKRHRAQLRIEAACEDLKKNLSNQNIAPPCYLDCFFTEDYIEFEMTRIEFENEIRDIVERTLTIVDNCFKDANLKFQDIDHVLLVGGSTRIPLVQEELKKKFGEKKISKQENPDEVVAEGAALQAALLSSAPTYAINEFYLRDVIPMALGTATKGNVFNILINKNTRIPVTRCKKYITIKDNQKYMTIEVYEGNNEIANQNTLLNRLQVDGISPAPAGQVIVEVTFSVDENGILTVTACENASGIKKELTISLNYVGSIDYSEIC